jgi:hypothetical protein
MTHRRWFIGYSKYSSIDVGVTRTGNPYTPSGALSPLRREHFKGWRKLALSNFGGNMQRAKLRLVWAVEQNGPEGWLLYETDSLFDVLRFLWKFYRKH